MEYGRSMGESRTRNVIVFTVDESAYAVELRWIRDVFTFGYITPVPQAPRAIAGVVNRRGAIIPVVDVGALRGNRERGSASAGESALLLEVDRIQGALRAGTIDEVSSLGPSSKEGYLVDSRGRDAEILSPAELFEQCGHRGGAGAPP
jgi:purine-binding chemotaxis protein CheW